MWKTDTHIFSVWKIRQENDFVVYNDQDIDLLYLGWLSQGRSSVMQGKKVNLIYANIAEANLKGAENLTIDQLSKVKILNGAKLDEELLIPLKEKYSALFKEPNFQDERSDQNPYP